MKRWNSLPYRWWWHLSLVLVFEPAQLQHSTCWRHVLSATLLWLSTYRWWEGYVGSSNTHMTGPKRSAKNLSISSTCSRNDGNCFISQYFEPGFRSILWRVPLSLGNWHGTDSGYTSLNSTKSSWGGFSLSGSHDIYIVPFESSHQGHSRLLMSYWEPFYPRQDHCWLDIAEVIVFRDEYEDLLDFDTKQITLELRLVQQGYLRDLWSLLWRRNQIKCISTYTWFVIN